MWMRVRVVRKRCVAMAERQRELNNIYNWRCAAIIMHACFLYVTNAFLTHMPKRNHALTVSHVGLFLFSIFQPMQSAMSQRWTSFLMMTFSKRDALIQRLLSQSQVHTHHITFWRTVLFACLSFWYRHLFRKTRCICGTRAHLWECECGAKHLCNMQSGKCIVAFKHVCFLPVFSFAHSRFVSDYEVATTLKEIK